jgi:RNA polymerase sigma-70 factor, ECF subfamily
MTDGHLDLAAWFEAHNRPLALYARQWLDDAAAADVVQDAFVKLLAQKRRPENVRGWLFRAVRNAALDEIRRRRIRAHHAGAVAASRSMWFQPGDDEEHDALAAQAALKRLPPEQGELIVMRIWGRMTYEQMAGVTGESVSAVYSRCSAALETLRRKMVTP